MKKIISFLIGLALMIPAFTQTTEGETTLKKELKAEQTGWIKGGLFSLNFSQAAYSKMWTGAPANTMSMNSLAGFFANFSDGLNIWENNLDLGYGFLKQDSGDIVKSDDKIELTSKYGRKAFSDWYYAGLLNFKSQLTPTEMAVGTETVTTAKFLSPGALLLALGMDWKPVPEFSMFISPVTYKADMIMDDKLCPEGRDNVESNIGGYLRAQYKKEVFKNISYESKLEAFSNYQKDEEKDYKPQNIDILWANLLTMKVNEYVNANFTYEVAHDDNVSKETQYKEVIGIGFSYKF